MTNQFDNQQYINIETFRKSGEGLKTPVWFVKDGDAIYIRTIANSGKVKRIRNNGKVNIAPCTVNGALLGEWVAADATEINDEAAGKKVDRLLDKKYGLMKKMFGLASVLQKRSYTVLEVKLKE